MPRTQEQERAAAAHRDSDGQPLLTSPDCPDCERRETAHYRCTQCTATWAVPGVYRWYWQGLGHWHDADDRAGWSATVFDHVRGEHGGRAGIVPAPGETPPAHSLPHSHPGSDTRSDGDDRG